MNTFSSLPPYPAGWYALGFSQELKPGQVLARRFMGNDVVLFRTASGKASAVNAYCPHMGAHFGHGGSVEGEILRCPFHGFCFDTSGNCVSTGYGTKPNPKGHLKVWHFRERNNILMVYHDHEDRAPEWEVPELEPGNFMTPVFSTFELTSHPQETSENSVDLGHLSIVHGYKSIEMLAPLKTDGAYLNAKYTMARSADFIGLSNKKVKAVFEIHMHGLGYSFVDVQVPTLNMHTRNFVLATPTDENKLQLRIGLSAQKVDEPGKIHPLLSLIPKAFLNRMIAKVSFNAFSHDVQQDFKIWMNKTYVNPPALVAGDGPVGQYRMWARQFYSKVNHPNQSQLYVEHG